MKFATKALVAAFALAIGGQAQAAIDSDSGLNATVGTGAGELFLSVIDRGGAAPRSYVRDLGITAADFLANDASYVNSLSTVFAADTNLLDMLVNKTGTIAWNLAAAHNTWDANFNGLGYLSTSSTQLDVNNTPSGFGGIENAIGKIGTYLQSVNGIDTNYAADGSQIFGNAANAFYDTGWGDMWNNAHPTEAALDQSLGFYYVVLDGLNDTTGVQNMLGNWMLSSAGTLTYTASVVPVPAAVWLLGSALIGMVGVARRKSEQAKPDMESNLAVA